MRTHSNDRAPFGVSALDDVAPGHPDLAAIGRGHLDDVAAAASLPRQTEAVVVLGALVALGARRALTGATSDALDAGVAPTAILEVPHQAAPYVGLARVLDALDVVDGVLTDHGVRLPQPSQATTDATDRDERGLAVQRQIAGDEGVRRLHAAAPPDEVHIQHLLTSHCFGDHLTRSGLDLRTRELLTLAMLVALGGADPQVASHVAANLRVGNDRADLIAVVTRLLPWIGYPRTLNALRAIDEIAPTDSPTT